MFKWLKTIFFPQCGSTLDRELHDLLAKQNRISSAGKLDGKHYTNSVEAIKQLKREGRHEEAIELLLKAVNATERESTAAGKGWGVAPWYYEQLAIIYRKEKGYGDEVKILERYVKQEASPNVGTSKLGVRLDKARQLLEKNNT